MTAFLTVESSNQEPEPRGGVDKAMRQAGRMPSRHSQQPRTRLSLPAWSPGSPSMPPVSMVENSNRLSNLRRKHPPRSGLEPAMGRNRRRPRIIK